MLRSAEDPVANRSNIYMHKLRDGIVADAAGVQAHGCVTQSRG